MRSFRRVFPKPQQIPNTVNPSAPSYIWYSMGVVFERDLSADIGDIVSQNTIFNVFILTHLKC